MLYCLYMIHTIKMFLVDNDLMTLNRYRQGLENYGYKNIHMFLNGIICLNKLNQKPYIIFLNNPIDDSSSFDILKKIKQIQPNTYAYVQGFLKVLPTIGKRPKKILKIKACMKDIRF